MSFLDRYAWLRTSPDILAGLRGIGLLMLLAGGLWAAFQRRLERLMAYTAIAETGFILLTMSLMTLSSLDIFFLLMIPRGLGLAIWALALSILKKEKTSLEFSSVQGLARAYPLASIALVLAALSTAGFPLLAGFPPRLALWQGLASESIGSAIWYLIGVLGLLVGAVRMAAVLVMQREETGWTLKEDWIQRGMLGVDILGLFLLGIVPQAARPLLENLPLMFQHLGR